MLEKPKIFDRFLDVLGPSIFTYSGDYWKTNRKKFVTVFKNSNLQSFIPVLQTKAEELVNTVLKRYAINGTEVDVLNHLHSMFFSMVIRCMMDLELSFEQAEASRINEDVKHMVKDASSRMNSPWAHNDWINAVLYAKKNEEALCPVRNFMQKITDEKIQQLLEEKKRNQNLYEKEENVFSLYFKLVYEQLKSVGRNCINDEMFDILTAGTGTVTETTSSCLMMLGIYPDIQEKVYNELREVFGNEFPSLNLENIKQLKYLNQVVSETLRRFTLFPYIHRLVKQETKIGECVYPASTNIIISLFGSHFNHKYYKDPWKFNPENFSKEAITARPKYTFVPFAAGPRNCIGFMFAYLVIRITIIAVIWNFSIRVDKTIEDVDKYTHCDFATHSFIGCPIKFNLREKQ